MNKQIVLMIGLLCFSVIGYAETKKQVQKNQMRLPAQTGEGTVRNLIFCELEKNRLEFYSIEVFAAMTESSGNLTLSDLHTIVSISAHGGFKMMYKGGALKTELGSPQLKGNLTIVDKSAELDFDSSKKPVGTLKFDGENLPLKNCKYVLAMP